MNADLTIEKDTNSGYSVLNFIIHLESKKNSILEFGYFVQEIQEVFKGPIFLNYVNSRICNFECYVFLECIFSLYSPPYPFIRSSKNYDENYNHLLSQFKHLFKIIKDEKPKNFIEFLFESSKQIDNFKNILNIVNDNFERDLFSYFKELAPDDKRNELELFLEGLVI